MLSLEARARLRACATTNVEETTKAWNATWNADAARPPVPADLLARSLEGAVRDAALMIVDPGVVPTQERRRGGLVSLTGLLVVVCLAAVLAFAAGLFLAWSLPLVCP